MGGTPKRSSKAKPTKLAEFLNNSTAQPSDSRWEIPFPPLSPSSRAWSTDFDTQDNSESPPISEVTLKNLLNSFRE